MDIVILCNIANGFQLRSCCKRPAKHSWDYGMCSAAKIIIHPPWDLRKTMNQLKILFTTTLLCVICSWFMHILAKKCKWKILIHVECHAIWAPWCDIPWYVFFSPIHCGHLCDMTYIYFLFPFTVLLLSLPHTDNQKNYSAYERYTGVQGPPNIFQKTEDRPIFWIFITEDLALRIWSYEDSKELPV